MEKKEKAVMVLVGGGLLVLSFLPVLPDPYYHEEKVCFWVWVQREIDELRHGEANGYKLSSPQVEYAASTFQRPCE